MAEDSERIRAFLREFDIPDPTTTDRKVKDQGRDALRKLRSQLELPSKLNETAFDLIEDWQSARTKGLKRFLLGVGFVLVGAGVVGADISELHILGLQAGDGRPVAFLWYLGTIAFATHCAFEGSRYVDFRRRKARLKLIEGRLQPALAKQRAVYTLAVQHGVDPKKAFGNANAFGQHDVSELNKNLIQLEEFRATHSRSYQADTILHVLDAWIVRAFTFAALTALTPLWGITT